MDWLTFQALLLLAVPVSVQDGDAEKLYRAMENKVCNATTLHVVFEGELVD
jgi:hypothetical protein